MGCPPPPPPPRPLHPRLPGLAETAPKTAITTPAPPQHAPRHGWTHWRNDAGYPTSLRRVCRKNCPTHQRGLADACQHINVCPCARVHHHGEPGGHQTHRYAENADRMVHATAGLPRTTIGRRHAPCARLGRLHISNRSASRSRAVSLLRRFCASFGTLAPAVACGYSAVSPKRLDRAFVATVLPGHRRHIVTPSLPPHVPSARRAMRHEPWHALMFPVTPGPPVAPPRPQGSCHPVPALHPHPRCPLHARMRTIQPPSPRMPTLSSLLMRPPRELPVVACSALTALRRPRFRVVAGG
jgi:hypothetical protein